VTTAAVVAVCICTFRRPAVADTIRSIAGQALPEGVLLRVIVADNDDVPSAREVVTQAGAGLDLTYVHAPARNISVARNACLDAAGHEVVAFIDDDETASEDWVARLWECLGRTGADAVFGVARAVYPEGTPEWIVRNDFHSNVPQRRGDEIETGHTCNVIMRPTTERFRVELGRSGGEDTEFFFRLWRRGWRFAICEEAVVFEAVAKHRLRFGWIAERRFAEGRHYGAAARKGRARLVGGSLAKILWCGLRVIPAMGDRGATAFWALRGVFHAGVAWGAVRGVAGREAYG
jgi:succinoglycan biosynthesis protein ExoM